MPDSAHPDHGLRPDNPGVPTPGTGHDLALRPDAPPVEPAGEPARPRSPDEYTEPPGSHRREPRGPATDVGA